MTQIVGIETFSGEEPSAPMWREIFAGLFEAVDAVSEKANAVADNVGNLILKNE